MNRNPLADFIVNKENKTIAVKKEFAAGLELVWDAWTKPELLDQWWAPKPYRVETKSMNFTEGGQWLYAMVSPEDEKQWCLLNYKKIEPLKSYIGIDAFCDEEGNATDFPQMLWKNSFAANTTTTTVNILITFKSLEAMEKITEMGFKEGFSMGMANLDELLETLS